MNYDRYFAIECLMLMLGFKLSLWQDVALLLENHGQGPTIYMLQYNLYLLNIQSEEQQ